ERRAARLENHQALDPGGQPVFGAPDDPGDPPLRGPAGEALIRLTVPAVGGDGHVGAGDLLTLEEVVAEDRGESLEVVVETAVRQCVHRVAHGVRREHATVVTLGVGDVDVGGGAVDVHVEIEDV